MTASPNRRDPAAPGHAHLRVGLNDRPTQMHPRQIRTALEFAARHPDDVEARIARNEQAIVEGRRATEQRRALLA